ncbi:hypothetical protein [Pararhodobacter zhoushanensis]|uniref:hypothetical protein n=1 Tax=Pararhodobacter zhoushanensis TaxID=2479545 RepID=UPI000F8D927E|nr:hypothetical protein [Pararhodobacter zhoushanensis]
MNILIIGDSHTGALERGRVQLKRDGGLPKGVSWRIAPLGMGAAMNAPFWDIVDGRARVLDPRFRQRLARIPPVVGQTDVVGLQMPLWWGRLIRGLLEHDVLPYGYDGPGRRLSPKLWRHMIRADMRYTLGLGTFLKERGLPVFAIEPPTLRRSYRMAALLGAPTTLALLAEIREVQLEALTEAGIPVVWMPKDATDDAGYLIDAYGHEDPADTHHANAAFGIRMLHQCVPMAQSLMGQGAKTPVAG